jgi:hypothetical protein
MSHINFRTQIYSDWITDWKVMQSVWKAAAKLPGWESRLDDPEGINFYTREIPKFWQPTEGFQLDHCVCITGQNIKVIDGPTFLGNVKKLRSFKIKHQIELKVKVAFRIANSGLPPRMESARSHNDQLVWSVEDGVERLWLGLSTLVGKARLVRNYNSVFRAIGFPAKARLEGEKPVYSLRSDSETSDLKTDEYDRHVSVNCSEWPDSRLKALVRATFDCVVKQLWSLEWEIRNAGKPGESPVGMDISQLAVEGGMDAELYSGHVLFCVRSLQALQEMRSWNIGLGEYNLGSRLSFGEYNTGKVKFMRGTVIDASGGVSLGIQVTGGHVDIELGPEGFRLKIMGESPENAPLLSKCLGIGLHIEEAY